MNTPDFAISTHQEPQMQRKMSIQDFILSAGLLSVAVMATLLFPSLAKAECSTQGRHYCVQADVNEILTKQSGCLVKLTIIKQITVPTNKARIKYPPLKRFVTAVAPPVTCTKYLIPGQVTIGQIRFRCEDSEPEKLGALYNFVHGADDPKIDCEKRFNETEKK